MLKVFWCDPGACGCAVAMIAQPTTAERASVKSFVPVEQF